MIQPNNEAAGLLLRARALTSRERSSALLFLLGTIQDLDTSHATGNVPRTLLDLIDKALLNAEGHNEACE